jgi:hypothetical protein
VERRIALWMINADYNEESFFVRHAYFLSANDPYKALKTTLRGEIDEEAWASLNSDTSRPIPKHLLALVMFLPAGTTATAQSAWLNWS